MVASRKRLRVTSASMLLSLLSIFVITADAEIWIKNTTAKPKIAQHPSRLEELDLIAQGIQQILHPLTSTKNEDNKISIESADQTVSLVLPQTDGSLSLNSMFPIVGSSSTTKNHKISKTQERDRTRLNSDEEGRDSMRLESKQKEHDQTRFVSKGKDRVRFNSRQKERENEERENTGFDLQNEERESTRFDLQNGENDDIELDVSKLKHLIREGIRFDGTRNKAIDLGQLENSIDHIKTTATTTAAPLVIEQQVNSLEQTQPSHLSLNMMFPPHVTVIVSSPKGPCKISVINIPLDPDMTVYNALLSAATNYPQVYPTRKDNPFHLILDYNKKLKCPVVSYAAGVDSKSKTVWIISVRDLNDQIIYRGQCLPDNGIILRPSSTVQLTYETKRSQKLIYSGKCQ